MDKTNIKTYLKNVDVIGDKSWKELFLSDIQEIFD